MLQSQTICRITKFPYALPKTTFSVVTPMIDVHKSSCFPLQNYFSLELKTRFCNQKLFFPINKTGCSRLSPTRFEVDLDRSKLVQQRYIVYIYTPVTLEKPTRRGTTNTASVFYITDATGKLLILVLFWHFLESKFGVILHS